MDRAANQERDRAINKSQERGHDPATPEVEGHAGRAGRAQDPAERRASGPEVEGHGPGRSHMIEQPGLGEDGEPEVEGHGGKRRPD